MIILLEQHKKATRRSDEVTISFLRSSFHGNLGLFSFHERIKVVPTCLNIQKMPLKHHEVAP